MQQVQLSRAAQRRLRLVDRARHRRPGIVDRALPLPDLARLSAPAQPADAGGAHADQRATDFHIGPDPVRVRRMLERPFGSVRWKDDTPDRARDEVFAVVATAPRSSHLTRSVKGVARHGYWAQNGMGIDRPI